MQNVGTYSSILGFEGISHSVSCGNMSTVFEYLMFGKESFKFIDVHPYYSKLWMEVQLDSGFMGRNITVALGTSPSQRSVLSIVLYALAGNAVRISYGVSLNLQHELRLDTCITQDLVGVCK